MRPCPRSDSVDRRDDSRIDDPPPNHMNVVTVDVRTQRVGVGQGPSEEGALRDGARQGSALQG